MPSIRGNSIGLIIIAVACGPAFLARAAAPDDELPDPRTLPWTLRDHYTLPVNNVELIYGADNAQWCVQRIGGPLYLNKVGAAITMGDGSILDVTDLRSRHSSRREYSGELGPGMDYYVEFPVRDGLEVRHSISYHRQHPFYVVRLSVTNRSDAPIAIAKLATAIVPPNGLTIPDPQARVRPVRMTAAGPSPTPARDAKPLYVLAEDRANGVALGIGVLPTGRGMTTADLASHGGSWQGEIATEFNPPVQVAPGETLQSDPVWFVFTLPRAADIDLYLAWGLAMYAKHPGAAKAPRAWVTVPDGESFADLQRAVAEWAGVGAALVPGGWEGRPGSLEGAAPAWPKDMRSVAAALRQLGLAPGITLDPLAVLGGDKAWTAASDDGQRWLNPAAESAKAYGIKRLREVADWGFAFYVVEPSRVPDTVLRAFNLSRGRADALALQMVVEATRGAPVFPASRTTLGPDLDAWLETAAATARLEEYGVLAGPVRFEAGRSGSLTDDVAAAMALCGAPIEILGPAQRQTLNQVTRALGHPDWYARPMDAASSAPRLWQVEIASGEAVPAALTLVSFPGARPAEPADRVTLAGARADAQQCAATDLLNQARKSAPGPRPK